MKQKKYDRFIKIRVSDEEYDQLKQMAKDFNMTQSGVIRHLVFQRRDYMTNWKEFIEPYKALSFDSRNITNNVNQISRYTNQFLKYSGNVTSVKPIEDLNDNLSKFILLQKKILELINKFLKI